MFPAIAGVPVRPRAQFSMGIIAQLRFATPALDLRSRPVWTARGRCAVQVVEARSPCLRARALPAVAPTTSRGTAHSARNTRGHQTASPKVDAYPQPPGPIQDRPLTLLIPAQRLGQPGGDQQRRAQHDGPGAGPQLGQAGRPRTSPALPRLHPPSRSLPHYAMAARPARSPTNLTARTRRSGTLACFVSAGAGLPGSLGCE